MPQKNSRFLRWLGVALIYSLTLCPSSSAEDKDLQRYCNFDSHLSYDIYFEGGSERTHILRNVEIVQIQEIGGKTFLVVRAADFSIKKSEGFILFNAIKAILPYRELQVKGIITD